VFQKVLSDHVSIYEQEWWDASVLRIFFQYICRPQPSAGGARPRKSAVKAEWLQKAMLTPASESSAILPLFSPFALKFQAQTYLQINDALPEMFAKSSSRSITKNDTNRK
jgi:hypothetical protein